jgi:3-dehydroquinate dehydratase/shikimate dehydrogenase
MGTPHICVTVTGRTMDDIRRARDGAVHADLVELRLDGVERPDVATALAGRSRAVIVTCRPDWEGGQYQGDEGGRRRLLAAALDQGAEFVDVEAASPFADELLRRGRGRRIVLSAHFFGRPPLDLPARYAAMCESGPEVVKLAAEVSSLSEMLPLFELAAFRRGGLSHVLIAMGNVGIPSRVLAARLGNRWSYAGDAVAPGQLTAERLVEEFRIRDVGPGAALYGVVGNPVVQSLSPAMHNAGFAALGLNAVYVPLQASDAEDFTRFAHGTGLRGASITAPFKVALMSRMDEVDPLARRVGAVNTLVERGGRWLGFNTDVHGFLAPLAGRIHLAGVRVTVLGAGGAARAVTVALADQGASVTISARRHERAAALAAATGARVGTFPPLPGSWDVLVNATPAGSAAVPVNPIEGTPLDGEIVFDLVYAPARTPLLAAAAEEGCLTIGGLEMLIAQAERQFELWTDRRPPHGLFASAVARAVARPSANSVAGVP